MHQGVERRDVIKNTRLFSRLRRLISWAFWRASGHPSRPLMSCGYLLQILEKKEGRAHEQEEDEAGGILGGEIPDFSGKKFPDDIDSKRDT